jgi:hypothetical protein
MVHISLWFILMMLIILSGNISTLNKKPEASVVPRKEFCLEVNAEKIMCMVMC